MAKTTNMLWMCVLVLGLACSASADEYRSASWSGTLNIPNGGQTTKYVQVSGAPSNAYVTKVEYRVRVDDQGSASNFWCSDYEIYIGNQSRGAWDTRVWNNYGGKTDNGSDDDSANDSDIYLDYRSLSSSFDGDAVNQRWYVGIKDNVPYHPLFWTGLGKLTSFQVRIYYRVKQPDLYDMGESYRSFSPTTVRSGQNFSVNCRVRNSGNGNAGSFAVSFYLSTNSSISTGDYHLGDKTVGGLSAGQSTSVNFSRSFPSSFPPAGTYYVGWIIDRYNAVSESDENDNKAYKQGYRLKVEREVTVPDIVGMRRSNAESALTSAGLRMGRVWLQYSDTVAEGVVISQDPRAGAVVTPGSDVEPTISLGRLPETKVRVPNVVGMSESQAIAAIAAAGLNMGTTSQSPSPTVPAGDVISQHPAAGTEVPSGSPVDLVVSKDGTEPPATIDPGPEDLVIDDFEDYTDGLRNRIFQTWIDGWGYNDPAPGHPGNGTGATVGYLTAPFAETQIVRNGLQSMPFDYNNTLPPYYSETEREFVPPQNWSVSGADMLVLYIQGQVTNTPAQLYVALEDTFERVGISPHPNQNVVRSTKWTKWEIPLQDFIRAGVDMSAVKKMYIGAGDRDRPQFGGTGKLYIDDIYLDRPGAPVGPIHR